VELRDLIVTPLLLMILYAVAFFVRPYFTDEITRRYFIPALSVRIIGALAIGFIYQFYYDGGDTFNYHTHGSRHLWNSIFESPENFSAAFFNDSGNPRGYDVTSKIVFFTDPSSYAVVRLALFFDVFTFSTYSSTAICFAVLSFVGVWLIFKTFYEQYPHLHKGLAFSAFFIPSVFFWGSGLLKDTVTLTCLGIALYQTYRIFISRKFKFINGVGLIIALYGLYVVKIYILLTFLPAAIVWITFKNFSQIRSLVLRVMIFPLVIGLAVFLAYESVLTAGSGNEKYSLAKLAKTAQITAYDIRYWTGREAGSGYTLGELDGTFLSMVKLAPAAINVSLFRPYLWEVKNPLMLLSALESFAMLLITIYIVLYTNIRLPSGIMQPTMLFLVLFALVFSFAVGVSTFNFGTLARYKIPMLPFLGIAFVLLIDYAKRRRNLDLTDATE
jgi:hypothetical protein